jgi:hypothetical protein
VPELYLDTLRMFNPDCAIVALTDDAHGEREHRLKVAMQDFPYLRFVAFLLLLFLFSLLQTYYVMCAQEFHFYSLISQIYSPLQAVSFNPQHALPFDCHSIHHKFRNSLFVRSPLHAVSFNPQHARAIRRRELAIYRFVDIVAPLVESDERILEGDLSVLGVASHVLHWGTNITKTPIPHPKDVPSFEEREGIVFVGFAANPTNRLAMEWFFTFV